MSQENLDRIRAGYEAWNRRDFKPVFELFDPAIVLALPEGGINTGVHHGHEEVRKFFEGYVEAFEYHRVETERLVEAGDQIVGLFNIAAAGRGSGVEVRQHTAQVWTMRAGKAVRIQVYTEWAEALEAVGLSE